MVIYIGNLIDVFNNSAPLMLVALGMTLVIATGGVDLSVGAVIAISAAMGAVLINPVFGNEQITNAVAADPTLTNTPLWLVVVVTLAAGTLCGLWNGMLVSRAKISPMVATLILMVAGRGIAQLIAKGTNYDRLLHALFLVWKWFYIGTPRFNLYRCHCVYISLAVGS